MDVSFIGVQYRCADVVERKPTVLGDMPGAHKESEGKTAPVQEWSDDPQIVFVSIIEGQNNLPGVQTVPIRNALIQVVHGNHFTLSPEKGDLSFKDREGHLHFLTFGIYEVRLDPAVEEHDRSSAPCQERVLTAGH